MWFVRNRKSNFERTSDFYKSLLSIEIESKKEMTSDSNIERNNGELTQRDSKYSELLSKFVEVYSKNQDDKFEKKKNILRNCNDSLYIISCYFDGGGRSLRILFSR